jgi:hypothetical protein
MLEVTHARHLGGFRLEVAFSNGESGAVDLTDALWGPVFEPLRNPERFACFSLSPTLHTVVWENGADYAPEFLRAQMHAQSPADTR